MWVVESVSPEQLTRTTEALNKSTIFRLMPEAGYRINDRWAIGLSPAYA